MSKRHQSSRRKSYGRRQHEIHERSGRRADNEAYELTADAETATFAEAGTAVFGASSVRLGYALLD